MSDLAFLLLLWNSFNKTTAATDESHATLNAFERLRDLNIEINDRRSVFSVKFNSVRRRNSGCIRDKSNMDPS